MSPAEREAADKRKRQLAQADTERQLGDRQTDSLHAGARGQRRHRQRPVAARDPGRSWRSSCLTLGAGLYVLWRRNPELLRRVPIPFRSR